MTPVAHAPCPCYAWRKAGACDGGFEVFDFECDIHGAAMIVERKPLMPRCLSDGEIDANIRSLKQELDAVALK